MPESAYHEFPFGIENGIHRKRRFRFVQIRALPSVLLGLILRSWVFRPRLQAPAIVHGRWFQMYKPIRAEKVTGRFVDRWVGRNRRGTEVVLPPLQ